jgi:hypothetical protein
MKKSKILWILIIFFAWAFLKSAGVIYSAESVTDYALLKSIGVSWLFYMLNIPIMLAEACTAYLLFKQKIKAVVVGKWLIVAECVSATIVSIVSMLNIEVTKAFYSASREARGMSERHDMDFLFSVQGIGVMLLVYIAFYVLVYRYLGKVKPELIN